jgi:hypothetical protein
MRAVAISIGLCLVGCAPDIVSGSYLCGPEQSCPPEQSCNGPDNVCVLTSTVMPFACDPQTELHEPDNTPAQALMLPNPTCVSTPVSDIGCLAAGDDQDWVAFAAPTACIAVEVNARVTFPVAFEPLDLELWDLTSMTMVSGGGACAQSTGLAAGADERCLKTTLIQGDTYGIKVKPAGGGDCGGTCNYNRYTLNITVDTPG